MKLFFRMTTLVLVGSLVLQACAWFGGGTDTTTQTTLLDGGAGAIALTVQATNGSTAFNAVGQVINYAYTVTNTGAGALTGPVTITDTKTTIPVCPALNTIGNLNDTFEPAEAVTCTSSYMIAQADLTAGAVTNAATALAGGITSQQISTTVKMAENKVLALTVAPNPTTYNAAGQKIVFTYTAKNTGATALGPAQFIITDSKIGAPFNCDVPTKTLAPNESLTCTIEYTISANDVAAPNIANSATISGGGAGTVSLATSTVTNSGSTSNPPPAGNFTLGSTVQHKVIEGEWLIQIARCYGADYKAMLVANPQITDPQMILPAITVSVPNIGSKGKIYGPPCVEFYTVVQGDTYESIAQKFNADVLVLKTANKNITLANGLKIKVPKNSFTGNNPPPNPVTPVPSNDPIRINIPSGSTSASVSNSVAAGGKVRYVVATSQGQALTVKLSANASEVALGIITASGTTLKTQDATLTFSGTVPATGDIFIDVVSVAGATSKAFTLDVSLTAPSTSLFERVADINPSQASSDPAFLTVYNNMLYFRSLGNNNTGGELWRYDPVTKAVSQAADIVPGAGGSDPAYLVQFGNDLYFRANGDAAGAELWRFNGQSAGRLTDINNAGDANPAYLAVFNNTLYFSAKGSDNAGVELWRTDGTTAVRALDINAGPGDSNPSYLTVFNGALYFSAVSADGNGAELYKFDGSTATRVTDINPGVGNSNPAHLAVFNNALYFSANDGADSGVELWKYDGTTASMVANINTGAGDFAPSFLVVYKNALYFSAIGPDNAGIELWMYDGTTAKRVGDLNNVGNSSPSYLTVLNGELYFQANGNDGAGTELWKYKGP